MELAYADRGNVVFVPAGVGFYPWCVSGPRTVTAIVHGFDLEMKERRYLGYRLAYNGPAARDSRVRMLDFLRRHMTPDRQGK